MEKISAAVEKIKKSTVDFVAFTSSSAVKAFTEAAENMDFTKINAVCIGERTSATARSYGMKVYVSTEATIESMINKIKDLCV